MDRQSGPKVSICIPVYNVENYLRRCLDSAIHQTLADIEIVVVDDGSTDGSLAIVQEYADKDKRITVLKHTDNRSLLQARKSAVAVVQGEYVLFLDSDDELELNAAELLYVRAKTFDADLVHFKIKIFRPDGTRAQFEKELAPSARVLDGTAIMRNLLCGSNLPNNNVCSKFWRRSVISFAYEQVDQDLYLIRAEDALVNFIALTQAQKYVSLNEDLYCYYFGLGSCKAGEISVDTIQSYLGAAKAIKAMKEYLDQEMLSPEVMAEAIKAYEIVRLGIISPIALEMCRALPVSSFKQALSLVLKEFSVSDIVAALARYSPQHLALFTERLKETGSFRSNWIKPKNKKVRRIAIQYNSLGIGGVQNVIFQHIKLLLKTGYEVFLILDSYEIAWDIPSEVELIILDNTSLHSQLVSFEDAIKKHRIQVVINHDMYSRNYAHYHTVAKICGCDFVFWLHNFCLRFFYDFSDLLFFHEKNLALMDAVVVLSQTDVAFWRWLGHENVYYLPNPISQYLIRSGTDLSRTPPEPQAPKLLWVGRLHQSTKRVLDLIAVVGRIRQYAPGVHLKIVGAEGPGLSKEQLSSAVMSAGLTKNIEIVGEVAEGIDEYYKDADFLLYTSVIEGFPMTLIEASSFGLPVMMYELPWLEITKDNKGIRSVPQGDCAALASEVLALCNNPSKYEEMTKAGSRAIKRILKSNVGDMLDNLLQGELIQDRDSKNDEKNAAIFAKFLMLYYEHVYRQAKGIK